jgi:hypothetical protein
MDRHREGIYMKIKEGFVLRHVGDMDIAVPVGKTAGDFSGMITLKGSGVHLFDALLKGCDRQGLLDVLKQKYDIDDETALKDIDAFLNKLREADILDEQR